MLPDLSPLASELLPILAAAAWKGALILAVALAAVSLMARGSASTRHAVLVAALAGVLLFPMLVFLAPSWEVGIVPNRADTSAVSDASDAATPASHDLPNSVAGMPPLEALPMPAESGLSVPVEAAGEGSEEQVSWIQSFLPAAGSVPALDAVVQAGLAGWSRVVSWARATTGQWHLWLVLIWLGGVMLVAARWSAAYASARRIVDEAEPLDGDEWDQVLRRQSRRLGLRRPVRLLRSERLAVPVVWGASNPAVLLPADCDEWPAERREVVLMHELAHVVRHDALTQMIAQAAVALHWFNPLAWITFRQSLAEREQACDDLVLEHGTRASDYAGHIVQIARRYRQESLALSAVAAMARSADLSGRVEAILDPSQRRGRLGVTGLLLTAFVALALTVPLAAFSPFAAGAGDESPTVAVVSEASDDWSWEGRLADGARVEVYGLNGAVRVREGRGNTVRVQGTPRGRGAQRAQLVVNETRGVLAICVVHDGQRGCQPGNGPSGRARNVRNATVNLEVTVPSRHPVSLRTTNGSIQSDDLSAAVEARTTNGSVTVGSRTGDVRVRTTNGAIRLSAAGRVEASTTNGSIEARFLETSWRGTSRLSTTNGAVRVHLPTQANVSVDARTSTGSIRSAFDQVEVQRRRGAGATASGTIGRGGRQLEIRTTNGGITLSRGTTTSDAGDLVPSDGHTDGRAMAAELRREIEAVDWEAIHEEARRAQEAAMRDLEGVRAELAAIDWVAIHEASQEEAIREIERARAEMAEFDWSAITDETRASLELARAELDQIDWDAIRRESLEATEKAFREMERARIELRDITGPELQRHIDEVLDEVRRSLDPAPENGA